MIPIPLLGHDEEEWNIREMKKKNEALRTMMSLNYLMTLLVSDIQNSIEYIIKKHETLTTNPPIHIYIHIYINRINSNYKCQEPWKYLIQQKNNRQNKECWKCTESWSGWSRFSTK